MRNSGILVYIIMLEKGGHNYIAPKTGAYINYEDALDIYNMISDGYKDNGYKIYMIGAELWR